jgi:hypothetical protein
MNDAFLSLSPEEKWHVFYCNKSLINAYPRWDYIDNYSIVLHMPGCAGGLGCDKIYFDTIFSSWLEKHNMTYNGVIEYVKRLYDGIELAQIFPELYADSSS